MSGQLPLGIGLQDGARFDNFFPGPNGAALFSLQHGEEPFVYLWGSAGSGRSHLLQAACRGASEQGGSAAYLPLGERDLVPAMLEGMDAVGLVALDDIQAVAGEARWELALFNFYNRARERNCRVLAAGDRPPGELPVRLADLKSRLAWGPAFRLLPMEDVDKQHALRLRALRRGLEMSDEVAQFILHRGPRDLTRLFDLLERLDRASLAAQRRLTMPFVREQLFDKSD